MKRIYSIVATVVAVLGVALSHGQAPEYSPLCGLPYNSTSQNWTNILGTNPVYKESNWKPFFQTVLKRPNSDFPPFDSPSMLKLWTGPAENTPRTSMGGWLSHWNRHGNRLQWNGSYSDQYHPVDQLPASSAVSWGQTLSIAGYQVDGITITKDGVIYLKQLSGSLSAGFPGRNSGVPVLLPYGEKLQPTALSKIRFGWIEVEGRDLALAQDEPTWEVFAVEFKDYAVLGNSNLSISVQVVFWKDGLIKYYYRFPKGANLQNYQVPGLWIGMSGGSQRLSLSAAQVFAHDAEISIWDGNTIRPGWTFFNSSNKASESATAGLVGERNGQKTMDIVMCDDESFFLAAWDYSRDLLDVNSIPKVKIDYVQPTQSTEKSTLWAFDEWRWSGVVWDPFGEKFTGNARATDLRASKNVDDRHCSGTECSSVFDAYVDYPGATAVNPPSTAPVISIDRLDSATVGAIKFSGVFWENGQVWKTSGTTLAPAILQIRSLKLIPAAHTPRSVEIMAGSLNPLGLKTYVNQNFNEGVLPSLLGLGSVFEASGVNPNNYTWVVEQVGGIWDSEVPFDGTIVRVNNVPSLKIAAGTAPGVNWDDWNGDFYVRLRATSKDEKSGTVVVAYHVAPVNDAPRFLEAFPDEVAAYRGKQSTISLRNQQGIWDETPIHQLKWAVVSAQAGITASIDPINGLLKLVPADGSTDNDIVVTVRATDGEGLFTTHSITVHAYASTIRVLGSPSIIQLAGSGNFRGSFKVELPTHASPFRSTVDLLPNGGLIINTTMVIPGVDLVAGECKVGSRFAREVCDYSFSFQKGYLVRAVGNPFYSMSFQEFFQGSTKLTFSSQAEHDGDLANLLFPATKVDLDGANLTIYAKAKGIGETLSQQLYIGSSEPLMSLVLDVLGNCPEDNTHFQVVLSTQNPEFLQEGIHTYTHTRTGGLPTNCKYHYTLTGRDLQSNTTVTEYSSTSADGSSTVYVELRGTRKETMTFRLYSAVDAPTYTIATGTNTFFIPRVPNGVLKPFGTSDNEVTVPYYPAINHWNGVLSSEETGVIENNRIILHVLPRLTAKADVRQLPNTGDLLFQVQTNGLQPNEEITSLKMVYFSGSGEEFRCRVTGIPSNERVSDKTVKFTLSRAELLSQCPEMENLGPVRLGEGSFHTRISGSSQYFRFAEWDVASYNSHFLPWTFKQPEISSAYFHYSNGKEYLQAVLPREVSEGTLRVVATPSQNPNQGVVTQEFDFSPLGWFLRGTETNRKLLLRTTWYNAEHKDAMADFTTIAPVKSSKGFDAVIMSPQGVEGVSRTAKGIWQIKMPHLDKSTTYRAWVLVENLYSKGGKISASLQNGSTVSMSVSRITKAQWIYLDGSLKTNHPGGVEHLTLTAENLNRVTILAVALAQGTSNQAPTVTELNQLPEFSERGMQRQFELKGLAPNGNYQLDVSLVDAFGNISHYPTSLMAMGSGDELVGDAFYQEPGSLRWRFATADAPTLHPTYLTGYQSLIPGRNGYPGNGVADISAGNQQQVWEANPSGSALQKVLGSARVHQGQFVQLIQGSNSWHSQIGDDFAGNPWAYESPVFYNGEHVYFKSLLWPPMGYLSSQEFRDPPVPQVVFHTVTPHRVEGSLVMNTTEQLTSGRIHLSWNPGSQCQGASSADFLYGNIFHQDPNDFGYRMIPTFRGAWSSDVSEAPVHRQWLDFDGNEGGAFYPSTGDAQVLNTASASTPQAARLSMAVLVPKAGITGYKVWVKTPATAQGAGSFYYGTDSIPKTLATLSSAQAGTWVSLATVVSLADSGVHTLDLWMHTPGMAFERLALLPNGVAPGTDGFAMVDLRGFTIPFLADNLQEKTLHSFTAQATTRFGAVSEKTEPVTTAAVPVKLPKILVHVAGMNANGVVVNDQKPDFVVTLDASDATPMPAGAALRYRLVLKKNGVEGAEISLSPSSPVLTAGNSSWTFEPASNLVSTLDACDADPTDNVDPSLPPCMPDSRNSYQLQVRLADAQGNEGDWVTAWFGLRNIQDDFTVPTTEWDINSSMKLTFVSGVLLDQVDLSAAPVGARVSVRAHFQVRFDDFAWSGSASTLAHKPVDDGYSLHLLQAVATMEKIGANDWAPVAIEDRSGAFAAMKSRLAENNQTILERVAILPVNYGRYVLEFEPTRMFWENNKIVAQSEGPKLPGAWIRDDKGTRSSIDQISLDSRGVSEQFIAKGGQFYLKDVIRYQDGTDAFSLASCNTIFSMNATGSVPLFNMLLKSTEDCAECGPKLLFDLVHPGNTRKSRTSFTGVLPQAVNVFYGPQNGKVDLENGEWVLQPLNAFQMEYGGWNMEWNQAKLVKATSDLDSYLELLDYGVRLPGAFAADESNKPILIGKFSGARIHGNTTVNAANLHLFQNASTVPHSTETGILWHTRIPSIQKRSEVAYGYQATDGWDMPVTTEGFFTVKPRDNKGKLHLPFASTKGIEGTPWSSFTPTSLNFADLEFERNGASKFVTTPVDFTAVSGSLTIPGRLEIRHTGKDYALQVAFADPANASKTYLPTYNPALSKLTGETEDIAAVSNLKMALMELDPEFFVVRMQGGSTVPGLYYGKPQDSRGCDLVDFKLGSECVTLYRTMKLSATSVKLMDVDGKPALEFPSATMALSLKKGSHDPEHTLTGSARTAILWPDLKTQAVVAEIGSGASIQTALMSSTNLSAPSAVVGLEKVNVEFIGQSYTLTSRTALGLGEGFNKVGLNGGQVSAAEVVLALGVPESKTVPRWSLEKFKSGVKAPPRVIEVDQAAVKKVAGAVEAQEFLDYAKVEPVPNLVAKLQTDWTNYKNANAGKSFTDFLNANPNRSLAGINLNELKTTVGLNLSQLSVDRLADAGLSFEGYALPEIKNLGVTLSGASLQKLMNAKVDLAGLRWSSLTSYGFNAASLKTVSFADLKSRGLDFAGTKLSAFKDVIALETPSFNDLQVLGIDMSNLDIDQLKAILNFDGASLEAVTAAIKTSGTAKEIQSKIQSSLQNSSGMKNSYYRILTSEKPIQVEKSVSGDNVLVSMDSATIEFAENFPIEDLRKQTMGIKELKLQVASNGETSILSASPSVNRFYPKLFIFGNESNGFGFSDVTLIADKGTDGIPYFQLKLSASSKVYAGNEVLDLCEEQPNNLQPKDLGITLKWDGSGVSSVCAKYTKLIDIYENQITLPATGASPIRLTFNINFTNWSVSEISADIDGRIKFNPESPNTAVKKIAEYIGGTGDNRGVQAIRGNANQIVVDRSLGFKLSKLDITLNGPVDAPKPTMDLGLGTLKVESATIQLTNDTKGRPAKAFRKLAVKIGNSFDFNESFECEIRDVNFDWKLDTWVLTESPWFTSPDFGMSMNSSMEGKCSAGGFEMRVRGGNFYKKPLHEDKKYYGFYADTLTLIVNQKAVLELLDVDEPVWVKIPDFDLYWNSKLKVNAGTPKFGPNAKLASKDIHVKPLGLDVVGTVNFSALIDGITSGNPRNAGVSFENIRVKTPSTMGSLDIPTNFDVLVNGKSPYIHPRFQFRQLKLGLPKIELASGASGNGSFSYAYQQPNGDPADNYWLLGVSGGMAIPNLVDKVALELNMVRPSQNCKTGIESGTITAKLSGAARIPLGTTGLFITGLQGGIYDGLGEPKLAQFCKVGKLPAGLKSELSVFIEHQGGPDVLDGQVGVWIQFNALNFGVDGTAELLKHMVETKLCAALSNGVFRSKAQLTLDQKLYVQGKFKVDIWQQNGKKNIAASAKSEVGIGKGSLFKAWWIKVPSKAKTFGGTFTNFGRFKSGDMGFTTGFRFWGENWGIGMIGSKFKVGGVGKYKLAEPPASGSGAFQIRSDEQGNADRTFIWDMPLSGLEEFSVILGTASTDLSPVSIQIIQENETGTKLFMGTLSGNLFTAQSGFTSELLERNDIHEESETRYFRFKAEPGTTKITLHLSSLPAASDVEIATFLALRTPVLENMVPEELPGTNGKKHLRFKAKVKKFPIPSEAQSRYFQDFEPVLLAKRSTILAPDGQTVTIPLNLAIQQRTAGGRVPVRSRDLVDMADTGFVEPWVPVPFYNLVVPATGSSSSSASSSSVPERLEDMPCVVATTDPATGGLEAFTQTLNLDCELDNQSIEPGLYDFALGFRLRRYNPPMETAYDLESSSSASLEVSDEMVDSSSIQEFENTDKTAFHGQILPKVVVAKQHSNFSVATSKWPTNWRAEKEDRLVLMNWSNPNQDIPGLNYRLRYWPVNAKSTHTREVFLGNTSHYELDLPRREDPIYSSSETMASSSGSQTAYASGHAGAVPSSGSAYADYEKWFGSEWGFELVPVRMQQYQSIEDPGQVEAVFEEFPGISATSAAIHLSSSSVLSKNKITALTVGTDLSSSSGAYLMPINRPGLFRIGVAVSSPSTTDGSVDTYGEVVTRWTGLSSSSSFGVPRATVMDQELVLGVSSAAAELRIAAPLKNLTCRDMFRRNPIYRRNSQGDLEMNGGEPVPLLATEALFLNSTGSDSKLTADYDSATGTFSRAGSMGEEQNAKQMVPAGAYVENGTVYYADPCKHGTQDKQSLLMQQVPALGEYTLEIGVMNRANRKEPDASIPTTGTASAMTSIKVKLLPPVVNISALSQDKIMKGRPLTVHFMMDSIAFQFPNAMPMLQMFYKDKATGNQVVIQSSWLLRSNIVAAKEVTQAMDYDSTKQSASGMVGMIADAQIFQEYEDNFADGDTVLLRVANFMADGSVVYGNSQPLVVLKIDDFECPDSNTTKRFKTDKSESWKLAHVMTPYGVDRKSNITNSFWIRFTEVPAKGMKPSIEFRHVNAEHVFQGDSVVLNSSMPGVNIVTRDQGILVQFPKNALVAGNKYEVRIADFEENSRCNLTSLGFFRYKDPQTLTINKLGNGFTITGQLSDDKVGYTYAEPRDGAFLAYTGAVGNLTQPVRVTALASGTWEDLVGGRRTQAFLGIEPSLILEDDYQVAVTANREIEPGEKLFVRFPHTEYPGTEYTLYCQVGSSEPFLCSKGISVLPGTSGSVKAWLHVRTVLGTTEKIWESKRQTFSYKIRNIQPMNPDINLAAGACQATQGSDLSLKNYPLLVKISGLALTAGEWDVLTSGYVFRDGQGNDLPTETERFDAEHKSLVAWVTLPEIGAGVCPDIHLYPSTVPNRAVNPVWTSHFGGVWHMETDAENSLPSSQTLAPVSLVSHGALIAEDHGHILAGAGRTQGGAGLEIPRHPLVRSSSDPGHSMSFWVRIPEATDLSSGMDLVRLGDHELGVALRLNADSSFQVLEEKSAPGVFARNRWSHVAWTMDFRTNTGKVYLDGHQVLDYVMDGTLVKNALEKSLTQVANGVADVDELRLNRQALPANWIKMDFVTQRAYRTDAVRLAGNRNPELEIQNAGCADFDLLGNAASGDPLYKDRAFSVSAMPTELEGGVWLQTANSGRFDDRAVNQACFHVERNAALYALVDANTTVLPPFLTGMKRLTGEVVVDKAEILPQAEISASADLGFGHGAQDENRFQRYAVYRKDLGAGRVYLPTMRQNGTQGNTDNMSFLVKIDPASTCLEASGNGLTLVQGILPGVQPYSDALWMIEGVSGDLGSAALIQRRYQAPASVYGGVTLCRPFELFLAIDRNRMPAGSLPVGYQMTEQQIQVTNNLGDVQSYQVMRTVAPAGKVAEFLPTSLLDAMPGDAWMVAVRLLESQPPAERPDDIQEFGQTDLKSYRNAHPESGFLSSELTCLPGFVLPKSYGKPYITLRFDHPVRVFVAYGQEMLAVQNALVNEGWNPRTDLSWEIAKGNGLKIRQKDYLDEEENVVMVPTPALGSMNFDTDRWLVFYQSLEGAAKGYQVSNARIAVMPSGKVESRSYRLSNADIRAVSGEASSATYRMNVVHGRQNGIWQSNRAVLIASAHDPSLVTLENGQEVFASSALALSDLLATAMDRSDVWVNALDLSAHGFMAVQIKNQGEAKVDHAFYVVLFEDLNGNFQYDANIDKYLGQKMVDGIASQGEQQVDIPLQGKLSYPERTIFAFVDPDQWLTETALNNNSIRTTFTCGAPGPDYSKTFEIADPGFAEGKNAKAMRVWDSNLDGRVDLKDAFVWVWYESGNWNISSEVGEALALVSGTSEVQWRDLNHDMVPEWVFRDQILTVQPSASGSVAIQALWAQSGAMDGTPMLVDLNGNGYRETVQVDGACVSILDGQNQTVLATGGQCQGSVLSLNLTAVSGTTASQCMDISLSNPRFVESADGNDGLWIVRVANSGNVDLPAGIRVQATDGNGQVQQTSLALGLVAGAYVDIELKPLAGNATRFEAMLPLSVSNLVLEKDQSNNRLTAGGTEP